MKFKAALMLISIAMLSYAANPVAAEEKEDDNSSDRPQIQIIHASELEEKEWTIQSYRVDAGDVLEVSVWQVEELNKDVIVRPDGMLSFPLIGDVPVAGYTLDEITKDLTDRLRTYIKNPQVSVIVKDFGGKKVVILGEISSAGIIRFTEPIKILEALALSGGFQETAGLKSVLIVRGDLKKNTNVIVVNVIDILKGKLSENIYVQKDDIIYIPRNFIGNIGYFVRQIAPLLTAAAQYYDIKTRYYVIKKKDYRTDTD